MPSTWRDLMGAPLTRSMMSEPSIEPSRPATTVRPVPICGTRAALPKMKSAPKTPPIHIHHGLGFPSGRSMRGRQRNTILTMIRAVTPTAKETSAALTGEPVTWPRCPLIADWLAVKQPKINPAREPQGGRGILATCCSARGSYHRNHADKHDNGTDGAHCCERRLRRLEEPEVVNYKTHDDLPRDG